MKKHIVKIIILYFIAGILFYGCATTNTQKAIESGKVYVPLAYVCQKYALNWEYDPVTGIVSISNDKKDIKLRRGSRLIIDNGQPQYLDLEVAVSDGILLVPSGFIDKYITGAQETSGRYEKIFEIKYIVIDAGHGGRDPGAIGRDGLREKALTLDIAKRVKDVLDGNGIKVALTREDDTFLSLLERSDIANSEKADFFVSIHSNSSRAKRVSGFEVFYLSESADDSLAELVEEENAQGGAEEQSVAINSNNLNATLRDMAATENRAESVELAQSICQSAQELLPVVNRGAKGANFSVLREAKMPAVLVEVGFISNKNESMRLRDDYYKQMMAEAIAAGILAYKKEFEKTNGKTY